MFIEQRKSIPPAEPALSESERFAGLVLDLGRSVRQVLAEYLDCWGAIKQGEIKVWNAVRNELTVSNDPANLVHTTARAVAVTYLEAADRLAIQERDVVRRLVVQSGFNALRHHDTPVSHVAHIHERLEHLPPDQQTLLDLYYARSVALQPLSVQRNLSHAELAHQICLARAACDWHPTVQAPTDDRLLHSMTEDLFNDTLDPDSHALLATSVAQDLGRGGRFERQLRLHLILKAMFTPFGHNEVQGILYSHLDQTEQRRSSVSANGSSGNARKRQSGSKHSSSSNRFTASQPRRRNHWGLIIAMVIGGALFLLVMAKTTDSPANNDQPTLVSNSLPSVPTLPVASPSAVMPPPPPQNTTPSEPVAVRPPQSAAEPPLNTSAVNTPPSGPTKPIAVAEPPTIIAPLTNSPLATNPTTKPTTPATVAENPVEHVVVTLINADTDKPIPGYEDLPKEVTIRLSQLPTKNLNLTFDSNLPMKSIGYQIPGCSLSKKGRYYPNTRPFSLGRDDQDFRAWTPSPGHYTLTITVYHDRHGEKPSFTSRRQIRFEE